MDVSLLKGYHGHQSSLVPLSSGHYFYLTSWDRTPTRFSSFSSLWLVTPEDRRILYTDPPASSEVVCIYHDFHEIHGAAISLDWPSEDHLRMQCVSADGEQELGIELHVEETPSARLLVALAGSPPTRFTTSKPMVAASDFLVNALVTKGGLTTLGRTETGQLFYHGATERLLVIRKGSATMNGEDLGEVSGPTWPLAFGDARPCVQPVLKVGTLYVPYEEEMLGGGD